MSNFIITTFYTPDYAKYLPAWEKHVAQWGYEYTARELASRGKWSMNDCMKPTFIRDMMNEYPDRNVVWVDVDSLMVKKPVVFEQISADFAGHLHTPLHAERSCIERLYRYKKLWQSAYVLGGTLWVANNDTARTLINLWVDSCESDPFRFVGDQDNLNEVLDKHAEEIGLNFYNLPIEYAYCAAHASRPEYDGYNKMHDAVILHDFASRSARRRDKGMSNTWEDRLRVNSLT